MVAALIAATPARGPSLPAMRPRWSTVTAGTRALLLLLLVLILILLLLLKIRRGLVGLRRLPPPSLGVQIFTPTAPPDLRGPRADPRTRLRIRPDPLATAPAAVAVDTGRRGPSLRRRGGATRPDQVARLG